jgi:hypothetical protein
MWLGWVARRASLVAFTVALAGVLAVSGLRAHPDAPSDAAPTAPPARDVSVAGLGPRDVVGGVRLGERIGDVLVRLGAPASVEHEMSGTEYTWDLEGGATFVVVGSHPADGSVVGIHASVPPGSAARVSAFGGVVVGHSTPRGVTAAWGPDFSVPASPDDDFLVRYVECTGRYPAMAKFGAPSTGWDEPVRTVLLAYAEGPSAAWCEPGASAA